MSLVDNFALVKNNLKINWYILYFSKPWYFDLFDLCWFFYKGIERGVALMKSAFEAVA